MVYPAFKALKRNMPDAQLHLLALRTPISQLAQGDPLWSGVTVFDPTQIKKAPVRVFSILKALRRERFTASISFFASNTWQYNLLPFICGIPERWNFAYHLKKLSSLSWLNTRTIPVDANLHDVNQNLAISAAFCNVATSSLDTVFPVLFSSDDTARANRWLVDHGCFGTFVGIHPGSSRDHGMDAKQWPADRFGRLAQKIGSVYGSARALVFGGPDEDDLKAVVANFAAPVDVTVVDRCDLRLTAALISRCSLFVCNDSGLMHIAALASVPTIALFGPTDEKRNGPMGDQSFVVRKPMPGFPIWTAANVGDRSMPARLDPRACLMALSVDDAWEQIEPWIQKNFNTPLNTK